MVPCWHGSYGLTIIAGLENTINSQNRRRQQRDRRGSAARLVRGETACPPRTPSRTSEAETAVGRCAIAALLDSLLAILHVSWCARRNLGAQGATLVRKAQHEYEPSAHALERLASAVSPGKKGGIVPRATILPRDPQDETTADIEVHLYGAHRSRLKAKSP